MNKILGWILGFTKLGKITEPVQAFLMGKKAYIAGAAIAIPAILTIVSKFSEQGLSYLTGIIATPEWLQLMEGLGIMGLRAAVAKAEGV